MCYADDARPPAPPQPGPVGAHGDLELQSADGTRFGAYFAHPQQPTGLGMVILPDVRGLHQFYKDLAVRFAEAGVHAVAMDYFGRTAGIGDRGEDFGFREHVESLDWAKVGEDAAACAGWLREQAAVTSVFTVGFCLGGAMSWRQSAAPGYAGCIGFYGIPSRVVDLLGQMRNPLLILAAGADFTPVPEVEAFAEQVRAQGAEVDMRVYPGAPHSFFDRTFGEHAPACADAWQAMLDFIGARAHEQAATGQK